MLKLLLCAALAVLLLLGLGCSDDDKPRVTVAAAADLQYAFQEMEAPFEAECGCDVVLIFGSSGKFAAQIEEGLPVDVFASANVAYVEKLKDKGLVVPGSDELYAVGRIVVAVPANSPLEPTGLDLLLDPRVTRIAIANPDHAPYGLAAEQALESAGLWEAVQPRLVLGENAAQTTQFVETGDANAGIVPLSLAVQRKEKLRSALIDAALHQPLRQVAGVLSRSERPDLAAQFIRFINGDVGRPIMRKYGFILPGEELAGE